MSALAVLTGDLVRSSELEREERAGVLRLLEGLPEELKPLLSTSVSALVDVYRGDSWQFFLPRPELVLRVALYIRARLRGQIERIRLDSKIGMGIGEGQLGPGGELSTGDGPAFRYAAEALQGLGRSRRMSISFPNWLDPLLAESYESVVILLDRSAAEWTSKQGQAIYPSLLGHTQVEIAAAWPDGPISQQAVAQHLDRAGWPAIEYALGTFEASIPQILTGQV